MKTGLMTHMMDTVSFLQMMSPVLVQKRLNQSLSLQLAALFVARHMPGCLKTL